MFDLKELDKWVLVGKAPVKFNGLERRPVRLEVLADGEARLYVHYDGKSHFIGIFRGYDVVKFEVPGMFTLQATGDPVFIWTPELQTLAVEIPEAVSFTRSMTRRERNPELELMMQKVTATMERRIAQVENDVSLRLSAERREELAEVRREAAARLREAKAERDAEQLASAERAAEDEAAQAGKAKG